MASASSSSSSLPSSFAPRKYDVFISFRGETRNNFTSHLRAALKRAFIVSFRDDEQLEKGDEVAPSLIQAIKDSSVSVVVFSQHYASSRWCLDELVQIMDYRKHEGHFVIPIFYNVNPSDVRNQTGNYYKKAFEEHEKDSKHDPNKVNIWRAALFEAGNISGRHCESSTDESNLIQEIVADVQKKLDNIHNVQRKLKDVIGIDEMIAPIEGLLKKSHNVGIWGMGGAGKTTMAWAVFAKLSSCYDSCCFLENVREETEKNGLKHVRNSLVSELLWQDMQSNPSKALPDAFVERRFGSKKALVVLDDVDSSMQLKQLLGKICNCLEGSKVIITTRNKKLLRENCYEIHEAKGLSYANSRQLFTTRAAFPSDDCPKDEYERLIKGFVDYTQHNPLALEVLGSYVSFQDTNFWDRLLRKLRAGSPDDEIQKVLRLSYDGLADKEKQIFLEIACFLKGESEEFVEELLESYGFHPAVGIQILKDKALIVTTNGKVHMHDLLQEMGLHIVRLESIHEPGKRSRLWDATEIYHVLKNCEGKKEVKGIMFHLDMLGLRDRPLKLTAKTFKNMKRIRFLKVHSSSSNTIISNGLESISNKIRYFHWEGYPEKSLPSNFCAEHLLELNLCNSPLVETLWEGVQDLAILKRLKLRCCNKLRELPNFSKAHCLEIVDLGFCSCLRDVHASLLSLPKLISRDVSFCTELRSLLQLPPSLQILNIEGCTSLETVSFSMISSNNVSHLSQLRHLYVQRCTTLRSLSQIPPSLQILNIRGCTSLEMVSFSTITSNNVSHLSQLRDLYVHRCNTLQSLSQLPPSLQILKVTGCTSLKTVSFSTISSNNVSHLSQLRELYVQGCTAFRILSQPPPSLQILNINGCTSLETVPFSTISGNNVNHLSQL